MCAKWAIQSSVTSVQSLSRVWLFTFCHKGGVIYISEVIDISPGNLDSSCASSSPAFLMMYSAYKLNKEDDNIQPWRTPFQIWNQSVVPCPVLTLASWPCIQVSQEAGQVVWYSYLSKFSTVYCDPHSHRLWHSQWSRNRFVLELSCFFYGVSKESDMT